MAQNPERSALGAKVSAHLARLVLILIALVPAFAQQQRISSPQVNPDRTVTFRLRAPGAQTVMLAREGAKPVPMTKDEQGVWTLSTAPLDPDLYGYSFVVDGVALIDPANALIKPNLLTPQSMVHVPGSALPWEVADVPHGTIHRHSYKSTVVGDQRDFFVYTPAAYDPKGRTRYPVLYLLHGFSDDASGWTAVGRAHVILDNLIAQGKARPMIVVMPLGYGAPEILQGGFGAFRNQELRQRNFTKFREALLAEVLPQVERSYRVSLDRKDRAIAGLSMGGAESLLTGLNHVDKFAWVGAFSTGGLGDGFEQAFPSIGERVNGELRLLWIACGTEDSLIENNRQLARYLKSKNVQLTYVETPGAHTWLVWRRYLAEFAPMLFKSR